jgi:hypothetical protein
MDEQGNLRPTEQRTHRNMIKRTHRNMIKIGTKMGAILGSEARGEAGNSPSLDSSICLVFGYIAVPDLRAGRGR